MPVISLTDYRPAPRYDGKSWVAARLDATKNGTIWDEIETFDIDVPDATDPPSFEFTSELIDEGDTQLRIVFVDVDGDEDITVAVPIKEDPAPLATSRDVRLRLGRDFNDGEEAQVDSLLTMASTNIDFALGKVPGWDPGPARPFLSSLCIELVCRTMANPNGIASRSETVGSYTYSESFSRSYSDTSGGDIRGGGIMLSRGEEMAARRAVFGSTTASTRQQGWYDTHWQKYPNGDGVYETMIE